MSQAAAESTPIRILVVDDHPIVRQGLVAILQDEPDFHVVGAVGAAEEALSHVERQPPNARPNVVLLDLELPGMGGIEAIPRLLRAASGSRVLVFTAYDADERVFGALRAGAAGYLLKGAAAEEIARGIRAVHAGGSYLAPPVAAKVLAEMSAPRRHDAVLSERERQVLRLVADGQPNKTIARVLAITERTVKFHLTSIMNKLGAENRAQAVALAVQRGFL